MQKFIFNFSIRLLSRDISDTFETHFFGPVRDKISDFFNSKRSSDDCKTLLPDVALKETLLTGVCSRFVTVWHSLQRKLFCSFIGKQIRLELFYCLEELQVTISFLLKLCQSILSVCERIQKWLERTS